MPCVQLATGRAGPDLAATLQSQNNGPLSSVEKYPKSLNMLLQRCRDLGNEAFRRQAYAGKRPRTTICRKCAAPCIGQKLFFARCNHNNDSMRHKSLPCRSSQVLQRGSRWCTARCHFAQQPFCCSPCKRYGSRIPARCCSSHYFGSNLAQGSLQVMYLGQTT